MPEIIHLENLPPSIILHIALYTSLTNASHLHSQLLAKNPVYEYAFIDPSILVSTVHALAAAYRAVYDWLGGLKEEEGGNGGIRGTGLRTPNVHSETVFSLSPSHNITDSFRRFGISPTSTSLLVIKIINTSSPSFSPSSPYDQEQTLQTLTSLIDGEEIPFTNESIRRLTDVAKVRKYYKIKDYGGGAQQSLKGGKSKGKEGGRGGTGKIEEEQMVKKSEADEWRDLEVAVLGAMALRSFV